MEISKIIGLKVVALKSYCNDKRTNHHIVEYILFDDEETFIELVEQDYFDYHDCNSSARHLNIIKDKRIWKMMMKDDDGRFPDANSDI